MKLMLDLEKESVQDLAKAINILNKVKENKENGIHFAQGLDQIANIPSGTSNSSSIPDASTSRAARAALEQEKMMKDISLSKIFGGR